MAVSGDPCPTCSAHRGPKGFPAGAAPQPRDSLPLSLSPPVPRARGAPPRAHHSAAPATARESAPPPLPRSKRLGAVVPEGLEGGGGVGRDREGGSLAPRPPPPGSCIFHTPTRLRPFCLAGSQWEHASAADDAEIRHGARRATLGVGSGAGSTAPSAAQRHPGGPTGKGGDLDPVGRHAVSSAGVTVAHGPSHVDGDEVIKRIKKRTPSYF